MALANEVHELCKGEVSPRVMKALVGMAERISHLELANKELTKVTVQLIGLIQIQDSAMSGMEANVQKIGKRMGDVQSESIEEEMDHRVHRNMGEV